MKKTAAILAGVILAGSGVAWAIQQEQTQEEYGTESSIITQEEREDRAGTSTEMQTQSEYGTQGQTQTSDPYGDAEAQTGDQPTGDPEMGTVPEAETTSGAETGKDVTQMSSEELRGKTITTAQGEEIGSIQEAGYSSMHREKVAAVNVGGFLGVGEKTIAIPLSKLQTGSDEGLQTTMSRDEIEAAQEFDPASLSAEQQPQQYEQEPYQQQ